MAALQAYEWPGNVRQLRNVVERTMILAPRERLGRIEADMLPGEIVRAHAGRWRHVGADGRALREARENFEREYLRVQIRRFSGNISKTASFIGMERSALHRKLKLLGMGERSRATRRSDLIAVPDMNWYFAHLRCNRETLFKG
jgi:two-component system nitrogen regulation response regulator NtrX